MRHTLIRAVAEAEQPGAFSGCSVARAPAAQRGTSAPPVLVNGVAIAEAAIAREAQNHGAGSAEEARAAAARALVIRELLLQRARALDLEAAPQCDAEGRREADEEALIRQVLEREAVPAEPTEDECRRVYAGSLGRFAAPALYEASHILISPEGSDPSAWDAAHGLAAALIAALARGEAGFAESARAVSACPTGEQGGALGQLRRGDLAPQIETALAALAEGQVSATPVRTRHGWHVVRLDRRAAPETPPFEVIAPRIREALRARAWTACATRYVEALAREARIEGLELTTSAGAPT